jgi:signal transduction histidine kinase/CheY-like chemotaxis protein
MNGQTAELLARLFPFHVRVGTDGRVVALGASMSKVVPDALGCGFLDRFDVQRPRLSSIEEVRAHLDELVLLAIRGTPLQMRGQFTTLPDGGIAFVGSPRIVDQSSVWSWPVGIRDFAPHDGGADYAMVIEAANMQLADLERLVRTLQEKERAERDLRLRAEDASAAKTNFLANISHEIRTPMTAILGYAELLRDVGADPAERAEWIDTIRRNGDHLLAIINDLLDLSKIEAGRFEVELAPVSVPDVVRDVVKLMRVRAASQGIALDHVVEDDLARTLVRTDAVRIRQVLLNLVGNAVKFTERGGVEVRVGARAKGPRLELSVAVRDTGCGIAPELLPRLFEPFTQSDASFTRRHGGTGLGLAISRRLASLLGGRIDVASEVDRGSVFTFTFDADRADSDADAIPSSLPMPSRPASKTGPLLGMRILLVEDSIDSQRILAALMSLAGADVDVAPDGISAVSRFDGSYVPDLVLMDIQMPGMDGIEATERIRARGYTGRIVALTAAALSIDRDRALRAGCEGFHLKPISREDLIAMCLGDLPAAR